MDVDLKACLDGDPRAWSAFVDRWSSLIFAAVRRTVGSHVGDAGRVDLDDPVQDVFVRLVKDDFRLLRTYDPGRASLSTWLTLVARSTTIDFLRRRRMETVQLEPDAIAPSPAPTAEAPSIPLHLLSERQRVVLRMLFDEAMSVPEVAHCLGVDQQTVRSTKHKALTRLREHLTNPASRGDERDPEAV